MTSHNNIDENDNAKIDMYYYHLNLSLKTSVENTKDTEEREKSVVDEGKAIGSDSAAVPLAAGSILMPKRMKVLQLVNCLRRDDCIWHPLAAGDIGCTCTWIYQFALLTLTSLARGGSCAESDRGRG